MFFKKYSWKQTFAKDAPCEIKKKKSAFLQFPTLQLLKIFKINSVRQLCKNKMHLSYFSLCFTSNKLPY